MCVWAYLGLRRFNVGCFIRKTFLESTQSSATLGEEELWDANWKCHHGLLKNLKNRVKIQDFVSAHESSIFPASDHVIILVIFSMFLFPIHTFFAPSLHEWNEKKRKIFYFEGKCKVSSSFVSAIRHDFQVLAWHQPGQSAEIIKRIMRDWTLFRQSIALTILYTLNTSLTPAHQTLHFQNIQL